MGAIMADEGQDFLQRKHLLYLEERKQLIDAARESARTFDKAVLAFGSAVFGFSIAFLKDVAPSPVAGTLNWLTTAWVLFSLGLLIILLSFLFSHQACLFNIKMATDDEEAVNRSWAAGMGLIQLADAEPRKGSPNQESATAPLGQRNRWGQLTTCCNFTCVGLLFLGLLCWSKFAVDNLKYAGSENMNKSQTTPVKKGYVPPAPPAKAPPSPLAPPPPPPSQKR